ncbi:hypothetical protein U0C82_16810 [Fulvimarina sp. 2208YS6-2-32]|uniref:Tetratricopeptide repeat protein n=1 Tax=Fulvimarina uroteuthidis TaxID=3098149 RepID=A0ABU5I5Y5_9HYPH|nr:hypothetical protein [Fulvimarina sp. 2208YS6-2-32]MDY8110803.1 hypothetical protein [Fulvimarina sp. 2208YS6-2-32]
MIRSRALLIATFLSTSFLVVTPVGFAQATADPFAKVPIPLVPQSSETTVGLSDQARTTLNEFYPAQTRGASSSFAPSAQPVGATSNAAPAEASSSNPFVPVVQAVQTPQRSGPTKPFEMDLGTGPKDATKFDTNIIDETALRYYADQRNLERVGAEIRRLKTLHPQWAPPSDLFAPRSTVDEQPVWDLFGAGQYLEARQKIENLQNADPNYRPSTDLLAKLTEGEARAAIQANSDRSNWSGTIAVARDHSNLLVCEHMDTLWRVGEAFARTDDYANAFDLYRYILVNCEDRGERRATLEKASALLPQKGVDALLALGDTQPDGMNEFDGLQFAKVRSAIAEAISNPIIPDLKIDPAELNRFQEFAKGQPDGDDAAIIGWYNYSRGEYQAASEWFEEAFQAGADDKAIEGYILSLRNLDDLDNAEMIALRYRDRSPEFGKIYIEIVADRINGLEDDETLDRGDLDSFTKVVDDSKSALGAQTLGWYFIARDEITDAGEWFKKSVSWEPSEEGVVGLAVVASREKDNSALSAIKTEYGDRYAALSDFKEYRPVVHQAAVRSTRSDKKRLNVTESKPVRVRSTGGGADKLMVDAKSQFDAGNYQAALNALDKREARGGKTYGGEILRGWANFKLNRLSEAERIFRAQDSQRSTKDTRFGIGAVQNTKYNMWPDQTNDCKVRWKC